MPKGIQFVQIKNLFVFSSYSSRTSPPPNFYIMSYKWLFIVVQSLRRVSLRPRGLQHARFPHPSLFPGVCSDSCPLCQWCHPTISSSVTPFSSRDDSDGKESACTVGDPGSILVGKIPWRREWLPTSVFLPGGFHGQRNLAGYSPWGCRESDTIEWQHFHFHIHDRY